MHYTLTFPEDKYKELTAHLFKDRTVERGAYALCRISSNNEQTKLLVRAIIPVAEEDIIEATSVSMRIAPLSFLRVMKTADQTKQVFVFIHSHPTGFANHSRQDDLEEKMLFKTAYNRINTKGVHASIVLSSPDQPVGRVWLPDSTIEPISMIRVIGHRFTFYSQSTKHDPLPVFFDRQVRAFGEDIQRLLSALHIGVVGAGGTGSAITEQLTRLGVGKLTISDGQTFESSNVNRVYGSCATDEDTAKVAIAKRLVTQMGLGTEIITINNPISYQSVINQLKNCDVIFGCTDDHWGRSILTRLAVYYNVPVLDMGVRIDSDNSLIKSIQGRVTVLLPGYACLFCRQRIDPERVKSESLQALDPESGNELRREGYAPELEQPAPSVIPFTTNIASLAVAEFIHRLTGFMGSERVTNEVIVRYDETEIKRNSQRSKVDCFCGDNYYMSRGDTVPLLDSTWRPEK